MQLPFYSARLLLLQERTTGHFYSRTFEYVLYLVHQANDYDAPTKMEKYLPPIQITHVHRTVSLSRTNDLKLVLSLGRSLPHFHLNPSRQLAPQNLARGIFRNDLQIVDAATELLVRSHAPVHEGPHVLELWCSI